MKREIPLEPKKTDVIKAFYWTNTSLYLLDQRKLPHKEVYFKADTLERVRLSIQKMLIRGAPAIGIVGAIGFYIGMKALEKKIKFPLPTKKVITYIKKITYRLATARPTAVNLSWALERMQGLGEAFLANTEFLSREAWEQLLELFKKEALTIWEEDLEANLRMGELGAGR